MKYGDRMDEQTDSFKSEELGYTTECKIKNLMNFQSSLTILFFYTFPHHPERDNIKQPDLF